MFGFFILFFDVDVMMESIMEKVYELEYLRDV